MKKIMMIILLTIMPNVYAASCSDSIKMIGGLNEATLQKMVAECEASKLNQITAPADAANMVDTVDKWSQIATRFVSAISLVAKEMGQTVNEFLPTPAGLLAAMLIIWQVMGEDIMHLVSCGGAIIMGLLWMRLTRAYLLNSLYKGTTVVTVKRLGMEFTKEVKTYHTYSDLARDDKNGYDCTFFLGNAFGLIIIMIAIFNL